MAESRSEQSLKDPLDRACCPHNWKLEEKVNLTRLKHTLEQWEVCESNPNHKWAKHCLLGYISYELDKDFYKSQTQLQEVLKENPRDLCALGTLAFIYRSRGMSRESTEITKQMRQLDWDDRAHQEARYTEAFAYSRIGRQGSEEAEQILEELHLNYPNKHDTQYMNILLDLIKIMIQRIDIKHTDKSPVKRPYLNKLGRYIKQASDVAQDDPMVNSLVLHLDIAARTSDIGKGWLRNFVKHNQNLSPEKCKDRAKQFRYKDGRDLSVFTCLIRYLDRHRKFQEAFEVVQEAHSGFPQDKLFQARVASHHLELSKKDLAKDGRVQTEELLEAISIYTKLLACQQQWWYKYKMALMLGHCHYLQGDYTAGFQYYHQSVGLFVDEFKDSPRVALVYINWSHTICLCNEHCLGTDIPFSHMRHALYLAASSKDHIFVKKFISIFNEAYSNNRDQYFYILCKAYLELHVGDSKQAAKLFQQAHAAHHNFDTVMGLIEHTISQKPADVRRWLDDPASKAQVVQLKRQLDPSERGKSEVLSREQSTEVSLTEGKLSAGHQSELSGSEFVKATQSIHVEDEADAHSPLQDSQHHESMRTQAKKEWMQKLQRLQEEMERENSRHDPESVSGYKDEEDETESLTGCTKNITQSKNTSALKNTKPVCQPEH